MKTNVNMTRYMGDFEITQRTEDGYFNATALLKQWNERHDSEKEVKEFLRNKQTKSFVDELKKQEFPNGDNSPYFQKRGKMGGTWMHPYLFVKFAMWLNPSFEYHVIKFVSDQLIEFRHNAGDLYRELASAASRFEDVNYQKLARGLNHIVFGEHESGIRQRATSKDLAYMNELQNKLAFSIDMGFITSFRQLLREMRKLWMKKHTPEAYSL